MECIEKAVRAFTSMERKAKSTVKAVSVDDDKMAKLYVDANRSTKYYNSKQHMQDVLNLAHGKIKPDGN